MLPPWRDDLCVLVTPSCVGVHWHPGLLRRPTPGPQAVEVAGGATLDWAPALDALDALLSRSPARGARATVVLSSHFVRYALVPESPLLVTHDDDLRFARNNFVRVFGDAAQSWSVRVSRAGSGAAIASAIPPDLIDALRVCLAAHGLVAHVLQPALTAAFNKRRAWLPAPGCLLVVVEPGIAVSAIVRDGWRQLRSRRMTLPPRDGLQQLIARERALEDEAEATLPACVLPLLPVGAESLAVAGADTRWADPLFAFGAPQPDAQPLEECVA